MVSFDDFIIKDDVAIYLQIIQYVKQGIVSCAIQDGDAMPSRRMLSSMLGINPNTIQKAYKLLEDEHLIQSIVGSKSIITVTNKTVHLLKKELVEADMHGVINSMKSMGIQKEEAMNLLKTLWEDNE